MGTELKKRAERVTHRRKEHEKDVRLYFNKFFGFFVGLAGRKIHHPKD